MNKTKRIAAIIGLVLFASIFIILLISSFFATEKAPGLFLASLFSALVIPIMIYMFVSVYKIVHKNDKQDNANEDQNPDNGMDSGEDNFTEASEDIPDQAEGTIIGIPDDGSNQAEGNITEAADDSIGAAGEATGKEAPLNGRED